MDPADLLVVVDLDEVEDEGHGAQLDELRGSRLVVTDVLEGVQAAQQPGRGHEQRKGGVSGRGLGSGVWVDFGLGS